MKQYLVIGLGNFGASIVKSLMKEGHEVFAVDKKEEKVDKFKSKATYTAQADASDRDALEALGVSSFDVAIITTRDNVLTSILSTVILKNLGVPEVVARAGNDMHAEVLREIGADEVVFPERDMGRKITKYLNSASVDVIDYIQFTSDHSIVEMVPPEFMINRTLAESNLRFEFGINVIAIRRGDEITVSPGGEDVIREEDVLVVLGNNKQLEKLKEARG